MGTYQHYFEASLGDAIMPGNWVVDVSMLNQECRSVVIQWALAQADKAAAESALAKVIAQIKFDITAAELGALLHTPGAA